MASKPDDSDYLSPAKRIKLDNNSFLDSENVSNSSLETANQENNSISIPKGKFHMFFFDFSSGKFPAIWRILL
jgi:hypothetical protein